MRLLITTQIIDKNDPALGFFHRWVEEFAPHFEKVHVICLKEGEHALPANVHVHSLGKEKGVSRLKYLVRFYKYIFSLRKEYGTVFVHMNEEYVLLGGFLWRFLGKRVVLWRNHKKGTFLTRIAGTLAHAVCYTSPGAYVASYQNAVRMPIGVDTELFKLHEVRRQDSILFLGRFDEVKKPGVFLEAIGFLRKEGNVVPAHVIGDPTPGREAYAQRIREKFANLEGVSFHPGIRNDETPSAYASHAIYVNLTPSGSFDKTIGEAFASGCIVVAANEVLRGVSPDALIVNADWAESVADGIRAALALSENDRSRLRAREREYIEREHSLVALSSKLASLFAA